MIKEIIQFFLSGKKYSVEIKNMQGIENYSPMVEVTDASGKLQGVVTIRDELIPILNMKACLSIQPAPIQDTTKYVILRTEHGKIALVVDDVGDISRLSEEDVQPCPVIVQGNDTGYVDFIARVDRSLILVINPEKLLTEDDWKSIQNCLKDMNE